MQFDQSHHRYEDLGLVRITYVPRADRTTAKDWAGCDVMRIQAYTNDVDRSLRPGPEIPIREADDITRLIAALCAVYLGEDR